jgi:hypothetical protein
MRSREETFDDKLFGVYVTSGTTTGAGCALLARLNGSTTVVIEARKLRQKLAQKLITENRNSKAGGSDMALDLAREAEMRLTNVSKQREEFVGCSRKWAL